MRSSILIADDDRVVRLFLRAILEDAGHDVWEAADGKEAMALVRRTKIDLVIVDLVMPVQEGFETIKILQKEYPTLKIVAMSGSFAGAHLDLMLEIAQRLGAVAALSKPILVDRLLEILDKLLNSNP